MIKKDQHIREEFERGNYNLALIARHGGFSVDSVYDHIRAHADLYQRHQWAQQENNRWRRELRAAIQERLREKPAPTSASIAHDLQCSHARVKAIRREMCIAEPSEDGKFHPIGRMWYGVGF